jgi:4-hydroxy-2-oxoheptanedioate aldolase
MFSERSPTLCGFQRVGVREVALARASRWGEISDHFTRSEDFVFMLIQVETIKALENLDEVLSVAADK